MALTSTDLAAVDAALASGELSIRSSDGKLVTMRSVDELLKARALIVNEMKAQGATPRVSSYAVADLSG